jgi:hypothetical protein
MEEIAGAVIAHCEQFRPEPPYKPELLKERLEAQGWIREARVPLLPGISISFRSTTAMTP